MFRYFLAVKRICGLTSVFFERIVVRIITSRKAAREDDMSEARRLVERLAKALASEADWAQGGPSEQCKIGNHCAVCQEAGECIAALLVEAEAFLSRARGE